MLQIKRRDQITILESEALSRIPAIIHAFSTRRGVEMDRARFLSAAGAPGRPIIKLKQVHSATVVEIDDTAAAREPMEGDAAVTALQGVVLGVQTADCVPIFIANFRGTAVAAVHAGWRGTAARIIESTVARLREKFALDPKDLVASIGPHIGVCCYEVGQDVVDAIADAALFQHQPEWPKPHLNLAEANRQQLIHSGLLDEQIEISPLCTRCREDLFHSYRRDGKRTGHMLSVIGILP